MFEADVAIKASGGRNRRVRNISTNRMNLQITYKARNIRPNPLTNLSSSSKTKNTSTIPIIDARRVVTSAKTVHQILATLQRISSTRLGKWKVQAAIWIPPNIEHPKKRPKERSDQSSPLSFRIGFPALWFLKAESGKNPCDNLQQLSYPTRICRSIASGISPEKIARGNVVLIPFGFRQLKI